MLKLNDLLEPHLGVNILYSGAAIEKAKYALILIHGRGLQLNQFKVCLMN
jgi:hypothetical protein